MVYKFSCRSLTGAVTSFIDCLQHLSVTGKCRSFWEVPNSQQNPNLVIYDFSVRSIPYFIMTSAIGNSIICSRLKSPTANLKSNLCQFHQLACKFTALLGIKEWHPLSTFLVLMYTFFKPIYISMFEHFQFISYDRILKFVELWHAVCFQYLSRVLLVDLHQCSSAFDFRIWPLHVSFFFDF